MNQPPFDHCRPNHHPAAVGVALPFVRGCHYGVEGHATAAQIPVDVTNEIEGGDSARDRQ